MNRPRCRTSIQPALFPDPPTPEDPVIEVSSETREELVSALADLLLSFFGIPEDETEGAAHERANLG